MVECIDMARDAGGEIVRFQGGYWAPRGDHPRNRAPSHGDRTVTAIVSRGWAEFTEYRDGRRGRFPIAMKLKGEGDGRPG